MSRNRRKTPAKPGGNSPSAQNVVEQRTQSFSGPIPPPSILEGYEQILPGAAERVLQLAEGDAAHQRAIENRALDAAEREVRRGQRFGLVIGLATMSLAAFAVHKDLPWIAGILGGGTMVGMVSAFLKSRKH